MNIRIIRYCRKAQTIDGRLYINRNMKICDTAENALHALPTGTYPIRIGKCHQHARKMPLLSSTAPCDQCPKLQCVSINTPMPQYCPMLTPGNGAYKRADGAIILGENIVPGCLKQPVRAFERVYQIIRKASERGHKITLTITEKYARNK